jgi:peptidoglycan/LPS O-acetylase OafA/YrhL
MEFDALAMVMLAPVFLTGSLLYLYRDRVPDSGWIAAACTAVLVAGLWLPVGTHVRPTSVDLVAPAVAYPLLWLGAHLPLQRVGARNDYSYGVYLYGFPVQALLAGTFAVHAWGYPLFLLASLAATVPFAVASWWVVERSALKLRRMNAPWRPLRQSAPVVGAEPAGG